MVMARASLALAVLAACGGGNTARPAQPTRPPSGQAAPEAPPPPSAPVPALPGGGERAFVIDEPGLVEVSTAGNTQTVAPATAWCAVDARANVVWFVAPDGLHAFDLTDRRTRTIIKRPLEVLQVIIDWGQQQLGGESKLAFDVGVALRLAGKPTLEMEMGCEGDAAFSCYEDGNSEKPNEDVAARQKLAGTLKLADPAYVAQLAERGKQGSLWSPPPTPPAMPKKKPTIDKKRCEDTSSCGALTAIPASPLWLVHTANSRGDFYHETRTLWDPATGEYVRRDGARLVRSKALPAVGDAETDYGGLRVSPAGVLTIDGAIFDGAKVHYAPKSTQAGVPISCGWVGGGWRIPGPTDG
jgi:hypothetical protein